MLVRKKNYFNFLLCFEELFEEMDFSTYHLSYILNPMQAILPRAYLQKWFFEKKVAVQKNVLENEFQNIIKFYSRFQRII
jgi:hypothetical protein